MEATYEITNLGRRILTYAEEHGIEHMNAEQMKEIIEKIKQEGQEEYK